MDYQDSVDARRATAQWEALVVAMEHAGAEVEFLEPSANSPAQVFTADGAIILGDIHAVVLRNDGPRGALQGQRGGPARTFRLCARWRSSLPCPALEYAPETT